MASEALGIAEDLARIVVRAFCEDAHAVVMDYAVRERAIAEDVLAERMAMPQRDAAKIAGQLVAARLLGRYVRATEDGPDAYARRYVPYGRANAAAGRTYYVFDAALLADATKLRLHRVRRALDERGGGAAQPAAYRCANCGRAYSELDAAALVNAATTLFDCEMCAVPLEPVAAETADALAGEPKLGSSQQSAASRLATQTRAIVDALRRLDALVLPAFDAEAHISGRERRESAAAEDVSDDEFGGRAAREAAPVQVHVEVELAGERKRAAAEMPAWHTHSTVTGRQAVAGGAGASSVSTASTSTALTAEMDAYVRSYSSLASGHGAASAGRAPEDNAALSDNESEQTDNESEQKDNESQQNDAKRARSVTVAGVVRDLAAVTDADVDAMTPDEYERYYAALQAP